MNKRSICENQLEKEALCKQTALDTAANNIEKALLCFIIMITVIHYFILLIIIF